MIDLRQFSLENEEEMFRTIVVFNQIYKDHPNQASQMTYYQLFQKGQNIDDTLPLSAWKNFMLDARVATWYNTELEMALNANLQKLVTEAGNNKSTATLQALSTILKHKENKETPTVDQNKIFIYTHIPLSENEEKLPNVTKIRTRPAGIDGAIQVFKGHTNE